MGNGPADKAMFFLNLKLKNTYIEDLINNIAAVKGPVTMATSELEG